MTRLTMQIDENPIAISVDPFYSPENQRVLAESIDQLRAGKGTTHDLIMDEAFEKMVQELPAPKKRR